HHSGRTRDSGRLLHSAVRGQHCSTWPGLAPGRPASPASSAPPDYEPPLPPSELVVVDGPEPLGAGPDPPSEPRSEPPSWPPPSPVVVLVVGAGVVMAGWLGGT